MAAERHGDAPFSPGRIKSGAGRLNTSRGGRLRSGLAVGEVALTLVLLAAAGLLLRSYAELPAVDPGFNARNLLVGYRLSRLGRWCA